jgi:3-phosphoshikimate 1-carboxyvinyltransferase
VTPTVAAAVLTPVRRLRGTIDVPSDKSIAHRALICAALAEGESAVRLREPGLDVLTTQAALAAMPAGTIECGNSGTTMRLLAGVLAGKPGTYTLTGDESLSRRPMERVADPLRRMGADVQTTDGHAPITINGNRPLRALDHQLPVASAQVLGAICFAALSADGRTTIHVPGPTRDHTERMLAALGVDVVRDAYATTIHGPARLRAFDLTVPGDFSSAAVWLVAATIHPGAAVTLNGVGLNPTRTALIDVLREMGASISVNATGTEGGEPVGDITVQTAGRLRAVSVSPDSVPALIDELPLLAVAMAAAEGTSEVRGAAELRVKESDRIATVAAALDAIGAEVDELPDGWRIRRGNTRSARVRTAGDHRVAMAMAVAGWVGLAESVVLDDRECVAISYPSFWRDAATLGADAA